MESLGAEDRLYEMGQGLFPAAFDEALLGMKKGETKSITLNVAENPCMMTSILKDKTEEVTFEIEIKAVKKKIAPRSLTSGSEGEPGLRRRRRAGVRMGESIEQQKGDIIPRIMENNALFALQERLIGEVPAVMAEEAERDLLQNFFTQLQNQGAYADAYLKAQDITADKFKEDVKLQAVDTVKQNLALDAWARHAGIEVSDEEIVEEFKNSGAQDPTLFTPSGRLRVVCTSSARASCAARLLRLCSPRPTSKRSRLLLPRRKRRSLRRRLLPRRPTPSDEEAPAAE